MVDIPTSSSTTSSGGSCSRKRIAEEPVTFSPEVQNTIARLESLSKEVSEDDEFTKFGEFVASKLRQLSTISALEAEEEITQILNRKVIAELRANQSTDVNYEVLGLDNVY